MRPEILNPLFADVTALSGVGPKIGALITRVAGPRIVDLLLTPPIGLVDRSAQFKIAEAPTGKIVTLKLTVDHHDPRPKKTRRPYRVICSDDTGFLTLIFFHAREDYLQRALPEGETRIVSGKIEAFKGGRQMTHPDYIVDPDNEADFPKFEAIYPLTAGLSANVMRKAASEAQKRVPSLPEWQDADWLAARDWASWEDAMAALHSPESESQLSLLTPARSRLAYDELLANQLALALIRRSRKKSAGRPINQRGAKLAQIAKAIPFSLTGDQKETLKEIFADMRSDDRMVRLVQGDVGSGKTVVALLAMVAAVDADAQAVMMAPTEILARQHLDSLTPVCEDAGVTVEILTGRDKGRARQDKLARLKDGEIDVLLGTHAVFQDDVAFKDLALVVIDEQHRFGVHQRLALSEKGLRPDILVMTATPIPRTLAMTAYGDVTVSSIREKPPGRKPVDTRTVPAARLEEVMAGIKRAVDQGDQAYWVCPLVEESDLIDLTAAEDRFESLKAVIGDKAGLVHGRMTPAEKDAVMARFLSGELAVLIATTVIEVGVNAPNATIMVIEHAERFGLAQLHQLRGRVGRGDKPATCLLLYHPPLGETAKSRLQVLRQTDDGFLIAEEDLRLRGAGDVLGAAQSGFPRFRLADIAVHGELLAAARDDAKLILERDPTLASERGNALRVLLYLFSRDDAIKLLNAA